MNPAKIRTSDTGRGRPMQAAIFDMDGTLIDSEPLWKEAEIEIFNRAGIALAEDKLIDARGLPTIDAVRFWLTEITLKGISVEQIAGNINQRAEELIIERAELMPGLKDVLNLFQEKGIPMAIASSSALDLIRQVVSSHHLGDFFDLLYSGEVEPAGKPHPGIFLSVAEKLQATPENCVVFEDSLNGIKAARAAGMKVVAFLGDAGTNRKEYDIADLKLQSFHNFGNEEYKYLESLMKKN
ncbi:MAG: HAD-IA family hydrolase [Bacteroidales bacterium]|jgi:sugar-phosphatase